LEKVASKGQDMVNLSGMRLSVLPNILDVHEDLYNLVDVNLARNKLFNGAQIFGVSPFVAQGQAYLTFLSYFLLGPISIRQAEETEFMQQFFEWCAGQCSREHAVS
jgi:hypothetical protein